MKVKSTSSWINGQDLFMIPQKQKRFKANHSVAVVDRQPQSEIIHPSNPKSISERNLKPK